MVRSYPKSLFFFLATAVAFVLQLIPFTGIFLMMFGGILWSILLINAGMIGTASEAWRRQVSRWWLILPIGFYGIYLAVAAYSHWQLLSLRNEYDRTNAEIRMPFEPQHQSLILEERHAAAWLIQNTRLPVAFSTEGHSRRIVARPTCNRIRKEPTFDAAGIHAFGFHKEGEGGDHQRVEGFCELSMPEAPTSPLVRVTNSKSQDKDGLLTVNKVLTTVIFPDGKQYHLQGGTAKPLRWIPMPYMGCGLENSSWKCGWGFMRDSTSIVATSDEKVLARALGLERVDPSARKAGNPSNVVMRKIKQIEQEALATQIANVKNIIADPTVKDAEWNNAVLAKHPEALVPLAEDMTGALERAADMPGDYNPYLVARNGKILIELIAELPNAQFAQYGPRILELYAKADDQHWLWRAGKIGRIGDLGFEALPYFLRTNAAVHHLNEEETEGLCRIGVAARKRAGPLLRKHWNQLIDDFDPNELMALYVTQRRMGINPTSLGEERSERVDHLLSVWRDITPRSPASVCEFKAEGRRRQTERLARAAVMA